jgi:molybdopterin-containing oxidoreductase family membrane subunit
MAPTTETVLGVFAHVDTTVRALEELRAKGYHDLTVYTPVPVHEIEDVLERDRPVSRVRLFTLIGGLTGTVSGFLLTIWSALVWGLTTGGKPVVSIPPFIVIAFELTILFGGLATLIGMVVLGRLPRLTPSPTFDPRFTNDRFGVAVHCATGRGGSVREILRGAGAEEVRP